MDSKTLKIIYEQFLNKNIILLNINSLCEIATENIDKELYCIYGNSIIHNAFICIADNIENSLETSKVKKRILALNMLYNFLEKHFKFFFIISENSYNFESFISTDISLIHFNLTQTDSLPIWKSFSKNMNFGEEFDFHNITNKFNLNIGEIKQAVKKAKLSALLNKRNIMPEDIYNSCYSFDYNLENLGLSRIKSHYTWNDLILPEQEKKELLHACSYIKLKHIVYDEWGYREKLPYGNNLSLLFKGLPGTGKTMGRR